MHALCSMCISKHQTVITNSNNNKQRMHNKQRIRVIVPVINCLLCVCAANTAYTGTTAIMTHCNRYYQSRFNND